MMHVLPLALISSEELLIGLFAYSLFWFSFGSTCRIFFFALIPTLLLVAQSLLLSGLMSIVRFSVSNDPWEVGVALPLAEPPFAEPLPDPGRPCCLSPWPGPIWNNEFRGDTEESWTFDTRREDIF